MRNPAASSHEEPGADHELYRLVAQFAHDWDYFRDSGGQYPYISSSCERITGYSVEEFVHSPELFHALVHPEDRDLVAKHYVWEMERHEVGGIDFRIISKDGRVRWIGHRCRPAFDGSGNWVGCRVSNRDITSRKDIERALRESEEKFRRIFDQAMDAALLLDVGGRVVDANLEAERLLGWTRDELLALTIEQLDPGLSPEALPEVLDELNRSTSVTRYAQWQRRDGSCTHVEVRLGRFTHSEQALVFLLVRDITERQIAHEELLASEQKYRTITESVADVVWTLDRSEHFTYISPLAERVLGYSAEEMKALSLSDFLTPEAYRRAKQAFAERLIEDRRGTHDDKKPLSLELEHIRKDGSTLVCEVSSLFLRDTHGKPIGYIGMTRDITERKQAEERRAVMENKMRQAQKLESLGVLAGGIAHDFNNLLMSVLGNAGLALEDLPPDSPCREFIEEIEVAGKRCADLCRQMLSYAGKGNFMVEMLDVNVVIREMVSLLRISVAPRASLHFELAEGLPQVHADASQIRQVVMSLVANAAEAIGDNAGAISVSTECRHFRTGDVINNYLQEQLPCGEYVMLTVTDNGCGMDNKILGQIFEPFFSTKFAGRGLGLSAVLGIVRAHKGTIDVQSQPGGGTTFKIFLPAAQVTVSEADARPDAAEGRGSNIIVVVDDEEAVRKVAARHLEQMGYQVLTAADGREAVAVFAEHSTRVLLVLLDLTMPAMSGEEVLLELQRITPGVRVVLSSGYNEDQIAAQFAGKGLAGFIHKPYDRHELADKIRGILQS